MPELPEVQAHAERLTEDFGAAELTGFRPLNLSALKTYDPRPDEAFGRPLDQIGRRGKYLLAGFGDITFAVHLMQGGRLRNDEKQSAKPKGGMARWIFADGRAMLLTEMAKEHRAGVWAVRGETEGHDPLTGLGPDADTVSVDELAALVGDTSKRIHGLLRRQSVIAGIGRRLANEICHRAKISPFASSAKLDTEQIARLHTAIGECIAESLTFERSQDEMVASKKRPSLVHHHEGDECPVCGDQIRAVEYRAYTVNYCATCQTGGKVLADNTTSKFLK